MERQVFDMKGETNISLFGLTLPLPRWTLPAFGVIAVYGVAAFVYQHVAQSTPDLVTLKQANSQLQSEVTEYGIHMGDAPTSTFVDPDGGFAIKTFPDKCVVIQRKIGGRLLTKLVLDLDRLSHLQVDAHTPARENPLTRALMPALSAEGHCQAGVHAGQFTTEFGARDGCWVQVWRTFEDGCRHYQMFNSCNGYWDTNPDGSPKVSWTHCVH
jgi:hypothetical protein